MFKSPTKIVFYKKENYEDFPGLLAVTHLPQHC